MLDYLNIKRIAADTGFDRCGIAPCRPMPRNRAWFDRWLGHGYQSSLAYMERNADKRFDPAQLVEGARTAIVCAVGYKNHIGAGYPAGHRAKVASYACTTDYHTTLRAMLGQMLRTLCAEYPALRGRAFVDTAPLAEKQLAVEAGLGWIGRQSLLVMPDLGSYVVLGELLLTDQTDRYDTPYAGSGCGACRRCVEHCPTGAIVSDRVVDTNRCIACHTIERQPAAEVTLDGWIFGCDACQSCCPYNRQAPMHRNAAFDPLFDPAAMTPDEWLAMDDAAFEARCGRTPLVRSGAERIRESVRRNLSPNGPKE
ncbi:tRNA epoxyqueuosine(34) reductase QueG [uncultured Alistipes sp.]|uniref:tRNA epoxyqueuosine(34) reductase QueG n=1 Tax=uncultured Alistipes sp. TaxID=538949 RepID=UPI003208DE14